MDILVVEDVIDTGQGIAAYDLGYGFEQFWPANHSCDRNSGGTGVGLAIGRLW